jgi:hypothetical protein
MWISPKKTQKTKPLKKIPQTDAIFENISREHQAAQQSLRTLRISIDTKAKVKIGNLSRGGKARGQQPKTADDHDTQWQAQLVPFGILNLDNDQLSIYFGHSAETSDFIVDCLEDWWLAHQLEYTNVDELLIDLDGGSATRSNRTQFIKRMVEFATSSRLQIRLIYYPPYHSKYNPIERCWAALENYWNGAILDSVDTALRWAANMKWKGLTPTIEWVQTTYDKGVRLTHQELECYRPFWQPSLTLPQWDITIVPA